MKRMLDVFPVIHGFIALLFTCAAVLLVAIAAVTGWSAVAGGLDGAAALGIIEALGLTAVAIVAVQIAQTITEEEIIRAVHISAPTRIRRFLSRFMLVVVVAVAIEALVVTFKAVHEDVTQLLYPAGIFFAVGIVLAGWGVFVRLNCFAEALEPETLHAAKREDRKVE